MFYMNSLEIYDTIVVRYFVISLIFVKNAGWEGGGLKRGGGAY